MAAAREAIEDQILAKVDGTAPVPEVPAAVVVPHTTLTARHLASRFLAQATFGGNETMIDELVALNADINLAIDTWITNEAAKPATLVLPRLQTALSLGQITSIEINNQRRARNELMLNTDPLRVPDQLRQRVAYALSQILVISDNDTNVADTPDGGSSSYYDMLIRNALGNYRTLLREMTFHPMMGRYLSHYRNRKENIGAGTRPDENFAREIMQLFTIGLYDLNMDGTIRMNGTDLIESYADNDITALARVFTGCTDATSNNGSANQQDFPGRLGTDPSQYITPMRMWGRQHDFAEKRFFVGKAHARTIPANSISTASLPATIDAAAAAEVDQALDMLFNHPNTAPFVSRLLIQRLVTSNPTPAYIQRVADVFANNGSGTRGDLLAVVRAILRDSEARDPGQLAARAVHGKLREPFLRVTQIMRAFNVQVIAAPSASNAPFFWDTSFNSGIMGMYPMSSPSVFNFFSPDFEPPGVLGNANWVGPEFQILNPVFGINMPNTVRSMIESGGTTPNWTSSQVQFLPTTNGTRRGMDYVLGLATNPQALLDHLDLLLTHGQLSRAPASSTGATAGGSYDAILTALNRVNTTSAGSAAGAVARERVRTAFYLVTISPDFCIEK